MGNGPDGFQVPLAGDHAPVLQLEDAAFFLDRRVGGLRQHTAQRPIAFRRTVALRYSGALLPSGTNPYPRGQSFRIGKSGRLWPDFAKDLLRAVGPQTGNFCYS